jgi:hypothetical protein
MRSLNSNIVEAEKELRVAVGEAMKTMKDQKKVPKVDVERAAYTYMGLGYCYVWSGKIEMAAPCYLKSATMWSKLHKANPSLLIPLFVDVAILLVLTNDEKSKQWTPKCIKLFDSTVKEAGTPRNAVAIARLASVVSGQKGQEMRLPLKENAKKIVFPEKLIRVIYQKSIGYLNRRLSEKEKDKNYLHILMLFRDYLQNTKNLPKTSATAPVTSEKDSNTKTEATSTATVTSTVNAPVTSGKDSDSGKKSSENKDLRSIEILKITKQIESLQVKLGVNPTT